jgi:cytidylate kinase
MPFEIVTIARQFGAGGGDLAVALGKALGFPVLDRGIIHAAATQIDADVTHASGVDEYAATALERVMSGFASAIPEYAVEPAYEVDPEARAAPTVGKAAARTAPLVVVGHGAQCLLAARPATLHVRVTAPFDVRARCVAERTSVSEAAAAEEVRRRDADRARYLRHHFGADSNDPKLYSVQFNTARLPVAEVTRIVVSIVRGGPPG